MKKRILALMLLLCMIIGTFPARAEETVEPEESKLKFTDVGENHPAYSAILYLFENGIINGKSDTLFYPDDYLKREEFAKILSKSLGSSTVSGSAPIYNDVLAGAWYADYVRSSGVVSLMNGISQNTFGVGLTLTRQDLAVVIKRYLSHTGTTLEEGKTVIYADSNEISDYAREAVEFLGSNGIMLPRENNMWCPKANATRAETAIALYNAVVIQKEQAKSLGRYGSVDQYALPHEIITDDKLAEMMPTPFDASIWPQKEIAYADLESDDYGILRKGYWTANAAQISEGGYESNGCIKITGEGSANLTWVTEPGEVNPGDYFALTAMVKGEDIDSTAGGYFCNILSVSDHNSVWLNESHDDGQKASTDWKEITQILMIPEGVNVLTQPEFYRINAHLYVGNIKGTVYFDNIKLSKIKFDPMDTVLMEPAYKGIIKGEGGIGDISLRAYINELNGMYDLSTMNLTAQIVDEDDKVYMKSESKMVTSEVDVHFSSTSLPMGGDFWLECILTDKETGEVIQKQEWGLHKREENFQTAIGVDEYGRVTRNGEPYFPLAIYAWMNDNELYEIAEMESVDHVQASMHGWYYNFGNSQAHRDRIQALDDAGKTISLSTGNMAISNIYHESVRSKVKEQADIRGLLTKLSNNFKDLPNLFAYYIFDEQNGMRYGEEHAWVRKIIESVDLDHPTTCAIDNTISFRKGIYAKTSDFLGYDPYPATGKPGQDLSLVYDRIAEAKSINPNRPVYAILQMFWYQGRGDLRGPTQDEFRSMAFQAICAGSCMLDAYALPEAKGLRAPGEEMGQGLKEWLEVYDEIQYLEPIIISVEPAPYYEVKGEGEWLNTMARRYDGKSYLFAVNNSGTANTASIYLDGVTQIKGMYSKKIYEANQDGWFEIEMNEYETEVFEWASEDYKSPHAELTHFGLSGALIADAESDAPTFIISGDMTEAEYSFKMSDFAEAYINGEKVETRGKINLEGLSQLTVKVVSEDGRFATERTYQIKRS